MKEIKLCDYGCGTPAKYYIKTPNKWCCNNHTNKCSEVKKHLKNKKSKPTKIDTKELCNYGCGKIARFKFKNGKLCCSNNINGCVKQVQKLKENEWNNRSFEERYGTEESKIRKKSYGLKIKKLHLEPDSVYKSEEYKNKFRVKKGAYEEFMGSERARIRKENLRTSALKQMSVKENRDKISGLNNYKGGKTHEEVFGKEKSDEIGKKIGIKFKGKTFKDIMKDSQAAEKRKNELRLKMLDKNHPIYSKESLSKRSGEKHPFWNPNRSEVFEPYTEKVFDKEFRSKIRDEQKNICPICEEEICDYRITIHHINYNKKDDSRKNLMIVHNGCNVKVNYKRDYWKNKLEILNKRIVLCIES